jgi:multiple sugar transport system ATP-binding protein
VAGFIGSPQMNFFDAVLQESAGDYIAKMQDQILVLPKSKYQKATLEACMGKRVTIGVRPEDIHAADEDGENVFQTKLDLAEMLGSEMLMHFTFAGSKTIARFPADCDTSNEMMRFKVDAQKAYVFDGDTGNVICD